jgi:glycosyltransferase involved in cell wall biosynthesis
MFHEIFDGATSVEAVSQAFENGDTFATAGLPRSVGCGKHTSAAIMLLVVRRSCVESVSEPLMRVTLVGSYPPPFGGVSVHLSRLASRLMDDGHKVQVFDTASLFGPKRDLTEDPPWVHRHMSRLLLALRSGPLLKADVVHVHNPLSKLAAWTTSWARHKGIRIIVTVHSMRYTPQDLSPKKSKRVRNTLSRASEVVVVGPHLTPLVQAFVPEVVTQVIPPFLLPLISEADRAGLPPHVTEFGRTHSPVLSINGSDVVFEGGTEIYGLGTATVLLIELAQKHPRIGLIVALGKNSSPDYLSELEGLVETSGCGAGFMALVGSVKLPALLELSDVFMRPTTTDGDAMSVREALALGVPTIASDAVPRPQGVVLYRAGEASNLLEIADLVIERIANHRQILLNESTAEFYVPIKELYSDSR